MQKTLEIAENKKQRLTTRSPLRARIHTTKNTKWGRGKCVIYSPTYAGPFFYPFCEHVYNGNTGYSSTRDIRPNGRHRDERKDFTTKRSAPAVVRMHTMNTYYLPPRSRVLTVRLLLSRSRERGVDFRRVRSFLFDVSDFQRRKHECVSKRKVVDRVRSASVDAVREC